MLIEFQQTVHTRADQLLSQLLIEHFDTLPTQCRHIEHMHKGVWLKENDSYENLAIIQHVLNRVYAFSMKVHTRADQLLSAFDGLT